MKEIKPEELAKLQKDQSSLLLIDVRQPEELQYSKLKGAELYPLMELGDRLDELRGKLAEGYETIVVFCRIGGRSAQAIEFLEQFGITGLINLQGGINAYAEQVDPEVGTY